MEETPTSAEPSSFSTLPAFTGQDEQRERATLSPGELASAEADLRGLTTGMGGLSIWNGGDREKRSSAADLSRLEAELAKLPACLKSTYLQAMNQCPDLVGEKHKIAFLEHENFDAKLAAKRLARYWEFKHKLFGPEKCFLPFTLDGAMKDEVPGLSKYCPFLVSAQDTSGRAVIFVDPSRMDLSIYSTASVLRGLWYMIEVATEDPDVRRRGIVELFYMKNIQRKQFDPDFPATEKALFRDVLPLHCRAIHMCHPNPILYYVIHPVAKYFLDKELRMRIKMHYGSDEKVLSDLEGYCLPRHCVPSVLGGDLVLDFEKWFNDRQEIESQRRNDVALQAQNVSRTVRSSAKMMVSKESARTEGSGSAHTKSVGSNEPQPAIHLGSEKRAGRKADPRMNRAVMIKLANPNMSALGALMAGGFDFPDEEKTRFLQPNEIIDADNVLLTQRRNQLSRRIRMEKKRLLEEGNIDKAESERKARAHRGSDEGGHKEMLSDGNETMAVSDESSVYTAQRCSDESDHKEMLVDRNKTMAVSNESSVLTMKSENDNALWNNHNEEAHKRRDSFYDTIMELPGIEDLGNCYDEIWSGVAEDKS